jgi:hypothetical protein
MAEYTEDELIELWEERAAMREFDGLTLLEYDLLTPDQRALHRRASEQAAYYDLRKLVGNIPLPQVILDKARKFRPE